MKHRSPMDEDARIKQIRLYHVPKKASPSLPFEAEEPLTARVEEQRLVIEKA